MLEYTCLKDTSRNRRKIDISKGIDVNKINASKECNICLLVLSMNHIFAMAVMI